MVSNVWRPDLSCKSTREQLPLRAPPYFNIIQYCRHIGYLRRSEKFAFWVARVRTKDGKYKQHRLGYAMFNGQDHLSHGEAIKLAQAWFERPEIVKLAAEPYQIGSQRNLGICPIGDKYTVGHALDDYLNWKRLAAARSHFETIVSLANYHIVPRLAFVPLAEFNGVVFQNFALDVLQTPPKRRGKFPTTRWEIRSMDEETLRKRKKTLNSVISILRGAFEIAWEYDHIDSDRPIKCLRRLPNADRPRAVFLDRQQCRALIDACHPDLRQLVLGALYTGCRANELVQMRVGDVGGTFHGVFVSSPKGRRSRHVFLPHEGMVFFLDLCEGKGRTERVFTKSNQRAWGGEYKEYFREARSKARLPRKLVFHGLRHTYASQLIQAGASLQTVADQLGHANTQTVSSTYGHLAAHHREADICDKFEPVLRNRTISVSRQRQIKRLKDRPIRIATDKRYSWPRANHSKLSGPLLERLVERYD